MAPKVDYAVYLVADCTSATLRGKHLLSVVADALRGGVTIVQYRDKTGSHEAAVATARQLHGMTQRYGVPLLINDRVDVAVEIGCEGVHIGQEDMDCRQARRLLGQDKIIGVTASSSHEALEACAAGADYLGIGTVYATATKKDAKSIIGPSGVSDILNALHSSGYSSIPTVCIGGINASNVRNVLAQSASSEKSLDGVAVVSAIVAADDPAEASRELVAKVVCARIPNVIAAVGRKTPLSHNMTNLVVQNFAANVALAIGASPIMSNYAKEAVDLAKPGSALVLNMGTVTSGAMENYLQALKAYNAAKRPVILDPVGAGATSVRRAAVQTLLSSGSFTIIKGNEPEIQTLHGSAVAQRGVDASSSSLSDQDRASLVMSLAQAQDCVVLLTGKKDFLSDGRRTFLVDNGHELLGKVTGTGCTLGTTLSAMAAAYETDPLVAALAGTVMFAIAAERAAERQDVRGPGSFVPAFLDELYAIRKAASQGDLKWLTLANITALDVEEQRFAGSR